MAINQRANDDDISVGVGTRVISFGTRARSFAKQKS